MKPYKIILVNIYSTETIAKYLLSSYVLKAYLKKYFPDSNKMSIEILNFSNKTEIQEIYKEILEKNPDYVGYSCYIWNIEIILKIIKEIRERSKLMIHILGGPEISLGRISSLPNPAIADYYVLGEGEKKFYNLISYLNEKKEGFLNPNFSKGIAYWENDKLNYSEDKNNIINLDEIPSIYLDEILEDNLYFRQQAFLETQRGCRFKCKYCVYHKNLPCITYYSLERVFSEIDYLIIKKNIKALRIFDAIFSSDIERAKEIVKHLIELKKNKEIRLPWIYWEFTPYNTDEEFIKLISFLKNQEYILNSNNLNPLNRPQLYSDILKNYTAINCVGIQSFCNDSLRAVSRPFMDVEKLNSFMNLIKKYNIVLKIDLIMGLPFETFESYFKGLEFFLPYFKDTDHILNIHRLQILPGSELENLCEEYEIKYSKEAPHIVFSTNNFKEKEINYASKLTAILFRILNSPLRKYLFKTKERTNETFFDIIKKILEKIIVSEEFQETKLVKKNQVDDLYWNDEIFREIPSIWLINFLENY